MLRPTLEEVQAIAKRGVGNIVPVYREVTADLETPVSAFLKVSGGHIRSCSNPSKAANGWRDTAFIGTQPYRVLRTGEGQEWEGDPLIPIEQELRASRRSRSRACRAFTGGAIGYVAYDACGISSEDGAAARRPAQGFPEAVFFFCDRMVVFDHVQHTIKVVSHAGWMGTSMSAYRQAAFMIDEIVERLANPTVSCR